MHHNNTVNMAKGDVKDVAFILFCENMPLKEIAKKLNVSAQTLTNWSKDNGWREQKKYIENATPRRLAELHAELAELMLVIKSREKGQRFSSKQEADIRSKIIKQIKDMSTKYSISQIIILAKDFITFTNTIDNDFSKKAASMFDLFINDQIKQQKWDE